MHDVYETLEDLLSFSRMMTLSSWGGHLWATTIYKDRQILDFHWEPLFRRYGVRSILKTHLEVCEKKIGRRFWDIHVKCMWSCSNCMGSSKTKITRTACSGSLFEVNWSSWDGGCAYCEVRDHVQNKSQYFCRGGAPPWGTQEPRLKPWNKNDWGEVVDSPPR